ncbi:hypothetical protein HYPSUDRAFT_207018 [Hypholoma sublateritium FD-334 SS-4]|uniref:Uncharacterized protein n=1 Tax=Hypholoma sublateritium (strain FD-334 SS-4) TaxID=945553 RepID=A0A0D2P7S1_HYPSF|nr:hypothetical protein HYPSUDRAFT_207018 [Hypholoma sublateritium FD-334 SS-4]
MSRPVQLSQSQLSTDYLRPPPLSNDIPCAYPRARRPPTYTIMRLRPVAFAAPFAVPNTSPYAAQSWAPRPRRSEASETSSHAAAARPFKAVPPPRRLAYPARPRPVWHTQA